MSAALRDRRVVLLALIAVAMVAMSLISPYFLNTGNLLSLLQYSAVIGLLALGQTLVILGGGGGIDLSIGSTLSLCSVVFGLLAVNGGLNPWLAALLTLVVGALLGLVNGGLITGLQLPPLIVTLGTLYLFSSAANVLSDGVDINGFDRAGFSTIGQTSIAGVPFQVLCVLIPAFVIGAFVMQRTVFGRRVYQVGSNERAAGLVGVDVKRIRLSLYVIASTLAAVGAIVTASWLLNARPTAGTGFELQAITIAVLGGTAITGGTGRLSGTFLALLLVAVLNSGLQLAGVGSTYQIGLLGAVLIVSMLVRSRSQTAQPAL
ncbi:ABC transporter permease [Blastococcus haudaquaticus]|uniref:Autoinducer 2 import system permease protein LsrD n=1 Tax=Blastococcus haudaquaticus TaxID=1938745 RepID=A0A286H144_9ACTN|nr:ABC transporter permease [Blastococcus haudaquaticus]SOE01493.1 ribose transport system permease protein/rhamnose transport system permease protein [Blastococcus haudaquaticus]